MQAHVIEMNGSARHRSPLPPPPNTVHLVNGNGTVEQWSKLADHTNGQDQVSFFAIFYDFLILKSFLTPFSPFSDKFEPNTKSKR